MSEIKDAVGALIEERGKVYGDPHESHVNIGLTWTALLQQHYGLRLAHPIPPEVVAMMMVTFKMQRSARVFHKDNYDDAHAYARFAEDFQRRAQKDGDTSPRPSPQSGEGEGGARGATRPTHATREEKETALEVNENAKTTT